MEDGFTTYDSILMNWEYNSHKKNMDYLRILDERGRYGELAVLIYMELREDFIEQYNKHGFSDLIEEVRGDVSADVAELAKEMVDAIQHLLIGLWLFTKYKFSERK